MEARGLTLNKRLQSVDVALSPGEMLGVIGPNGSGKSSLLQSLAGLLPASGEVLLDGRPYAAFSALERARRIGFLPQFCESVWSLAAEDIVALGRLPWRDQETETGRAAIAEALRETETLPFAQKRVDQLSGGERARVWLARALAGCPSVILADEPIASLDLFYQARVMGTLRRFAQAPRGAVVALHDLALAARYCDQICLMREGCVAAQGKPAEVLTKAMLSEVFGVPIHVDLACSPPVILPVWTKTI